MVLNVPRSNSENIYMYIYIFKSEEQPEGHRFSPVALLFQHEGGLLLVFKHLDPSAESPHTELQKVKVNTLDWSEKSVPNDAVMTGHTFCAVSAFVLLYRLFCCSSTCASAIV